MGFFEVPFGTPISPYINDKQELLSTLPSNFVESPTTIKKELNEILNTKIFSNDNAFYELSGTRSYRSSTQIDKIIEKRENDHGVYHERQQEEILMSTESEKVPNKYDTSKETNHDSTCKNRTDESEETNHYCKKKDKNLDIINIYIERIKQEQKTSTITDKVKLKNALEIEFTIQELRWKYLKGKPTINDTYVQEKIKRHAKNKYNVNNGVENSINDKQGDSVSKLGGRNVARKEPAPFSVRGGKIDTKNDPADKVVSNKNDESKEPSGQKWDKTSIANKQESSIKQGCGTKSLSPKVTTSISSNDNLLNQKQNMDRKSKIGGPTEAILLTYAATETADELDEPSVFENSPNNSIDQLIVDFNQVIFKIESEISRIKVLIASSSHGLPKEKSPYHLSTQKASKVEIQTQIKSREAFLQSIERAYIRKIQQIHQKETRLDKPSKNSNAREQLQTENTSFTVKETTKVQQNRTKEKQRINNEKEPTKQDNLKHEERQEDVSTDQN